MVVVVIVVVAVIVVAVGIVVVVAILVAVIVVVVVIMVVVVAGVVAAVGSVVVVSRHALQNEKSTLKSSRAGSSRGLGRFGVESGSCWGRLRVESDGVGSGSE